MRRRDLEQRLRISGCYLKRQGASHSLWINPKNGAVEAVPRHSVLTHSLRTMVEKLVVSKPTFATIHHEATRLDRLYIPTRYPNGWPDGSPYQYYTVQDFEEAYEQLKAGFGVSSPPD